jgi:hypothetical protein
MIVGLVLLTVAVLVLAISQLLLWRRVAGGGWSSAGASDARWKDLNDVIRTWFGVIGTLAAISFSAYSIWHGNATFVRQHRLEQSRAEEVTLRETKIALTEFYNAGLIFLSTWERYRREIGDDKQMEREIRNDFVQAWKAFERSMNSVIAVASAPGRDAALAPPLQKAYEQAARVFDVLMDGSNPAVTEANFESAPETSELNAAISEAQKALDYRLAHLYTDLQ